MVDKEKEELNRRVINLTDQVQKKTRQYEETKKQLEQQKEENKKILQLEKEIEKLKGQLDKKEKIQEEKIKVEPIKYNQIHSAKSNDVTTPSITYNNNYNYNNKNNNNNCCSFQKCLSVFLALIFGGFYTIYSAFTFNSGQKFNRYLLIGILELIFVFVGNLVAAIIVLVDNPDF